MEAEVKMRELENLNELKDEYLKLANDPCVGQEEFDDVVYELEDEYLRLVKTGLEECVIEELIDEVLVYSFTYILLILVREIKLSKEVLFKILETLPNETVEEDDIRDEVIKQLDLQNISYKDLAH